MSLRRIAALLAAAGLMVGLLGTGVGASFFDSVTGVENINVGTFDCEVVWVTTPGGSFTANSATYDAPTIQSSAPGSAPFQFDVKNVGSIPMALSVSGPLWGGTLDGSFSGMAATLSAATLAPGATSTVSTGIQWTALDSNDLGDSGSATWTVSCGEVPVAVDSPEWVFGPNGWAGWSCPAATPNILSASVSGAPALTPILWKPGATAGAYTYPTTPFGYTYAAGETGAIVQAGPGGGSYQLHLLCLP